MSQKSDKKKRFKTISSLFYMLNCFKYFDAKCFKNSLRLWTISSYHAQFLMSKYSQRSNLSSLQNIFAGNLVWFSVSVRGHHGWARGEILGLQILGKWHFSLLFLRHRHSVTLWIYVTNPQKSKYNNFIPSTFFTKIPLARAW